MGTLSLVKSVLTMCSGPVILFWTDKLGCRGYSVLRKIIDREIF